jgi:hypothetical protein
VSMDRWRRGLTKVLRDTCPNDTLSTANGKRNGLRLVQDLFDNRQVCNHLHCRRDGGEKPVQITGAWRSGVPGPDLHMFLSFSVVSLLVDCTI